MDVVVLTHSSVKQHAFGAVVVGVRAAVAVALRLTCAARELGHVGVELIEVGGLEGLAVVDASRLVKLAVQNDLSVGMLQSDVGDHLGQIRPRLFRQGIPKPIYVLRVKPAESVRRQMGAIEVAHKRLKKPSFLHIW